MAEEDIYKNKRKYENFVKNYKVIMTLPPINDWKRKYYCKNPDNLKYFKKLFALFEARDLSYIRRLRVIHSYKFIIHSTIKDISKCEREDINKIMTSMHKTHKSPHSKETFVKDLKVIWKILFPEKDQKGREDELIVPYPVRHLSGKVHISRQKLRKDKFTWEIFEKIMNYFANEPMMQYFLIQSVESLARPQELCYVRIGDIEHHASYAKIYLSEHGKEGPGILQCIDSYPYLLKWLKVHPYFKDEKAFLFLTRGDKNRYKQTSPVNINKQIRKACKGLSINLPITCYSLKRNGVTFRRLRGESDMEIQHAARWTSTKQLKTYDLSSQDEAFKLALEKRGLISPKKQTMKSSHVQNCPFCDEDVGFTDSICPKCKHLIDRSTILDEVGKDEKIKNLTNTITDLTNRFDGIKQEILRDLAEQIIEMKRSK